MTEPPSATRLRLSAGLGAILLFTGWLVTHLPRMVQTQNGWIRAGLCLSFALAILRRGISTAGRVDTPPSTPHRASSSAFPFLALAGTALALTGLLIPIRQMEWLGMTLLLITGLMAAFPQLGIRDLAPVWCMLYFLHPLPAQLFSPLETGGQWGSIHLAERLLHVMNVRIWADGLVLRTGGVDFEVPSSCSGLRAMTTVLLMILGLGLYRRMPRAYWLVMIPLGIAQALLLNVIRIVILVLGFRHAGASTAWTALHDSTGLVSLAGIILAWLEWNVWDRRLQINRQRRADPQFDRFLHMSPFPPFWRVVARARSYWPALTLLALLTLLTLYKNRAYHRAEMIKSVAMALRDAGRLDSAQRAADSVLHLAPFDSDWRVARARLFLLRDQHEQTLHELRFAPDHTAAQQIEKRILEAYALVGLKRLDEARERINQLPERYRLHDVRVAMILAEMAMVTGDAETTARHLLVAARYQAQLPRIRMLYPFLRANRQWHAIRDTDRPVPHTDPAQALAATEASMNLNQSARVAAIVAQAITTWPDDPRFLEPLYYMTLQRNHPDWEARFADHLVRCLDLLDGVEPLYNLLPKCFQLARPDLAWILVDRIRRIDPEHPLLPLSAARFGDRWFTFKQRFVGLPAAYQDQEIRVMSLYRLGMNLSEWQSFGAWIPYGVELAVEDTTEPRRQLLGMARTGFESRAAIAPLSSPLEYEYVRTLELADQPAEAMARLNRLADRVPDVQDRNRLLISEIYERQAEWVQVYETLHGYADSPEPDLVPLLRLSRAQQALGLPVAALQTARIAATRYPQSSEAATQWAKLLLDQGQADHALHILSKPRARRTRVMDFLEFEALYRSHRYNELAEFCRNALIVPPANLPAQTQTDRLLPAEAACFSYRFTLPSGDDYARQAAAIRTNLRQETGEFLGPLYRLWIESYQSGCRGDAAERDQWASLGRNRFEQSIALTQLALLLAREQRGEAAAEAAEAAARTARDSDSTWLLAITLSPRRVPLIQEAFAACPDHPEIWLASLVASTVDTPRPAESNLTAFIRHSLSNAVPTPAHLARASDFLLRAGFQKAAHTAAREAVRQSRGLLPVCLAGLRSARSVQDHNLAIESAHKAIAASIHPDTSLLRLLVALKTDGTMIDLDTAMVQALRTLRQREPGNPLWAQMLGIVRFNRGGWEIVDAMAQMHDAIEAGAGNRTPYIVVAEAARRLGDLDRSRSVLEEGLRLHPNDLALINNLAFTLALSPGRENDARQWIPALEAAAGDNPHIRDTLAVVLFKTGKPETARRMLLEIIQQESADSHFGFRARLHLAEMALSSDNLREAQQHLLDISTRTKGMADDDVVKAGALLRELDTRLQAQPSTPR
ncbi:MAG: hypothetical protein A2498_16425 [Lentisphaerae bacterium RIFOXYC12_FULL_60_16]|nr:MAG: hypothetical protein A2498_16425 [Lentisphaerae bacterium RIFOXYC12_FULL_60_16]OGV76723.1 MAG: hypothetical protein A2340_08235 [Lentisphaerae bacterium RIFOXYB12_FULL_60_10]